MTSVSESSCYQGSAQKTTDLPPAESGSMPATMHRRTITDESYQFSPVVTDSNFNCKPSEEQSDSSLKDLVGTLAGVVESLLQSFMTIIQNLMQGKASEPTPQTPAPQTPAPQTPAPQTPTTQPPANGPTSGTTAPTTGTEGKKEDKKPRKLGKTGEFLWKPVSEKNQKLVVLTPSKLTGKIKSVKILSPDGTKVLDKGERSGEPANGNREHFRFSKAGSGYPDNCIVQITLKDGSTRNVTVRETSQRYQR